MALVSLHWLYSTNRCLRDGIQWAKEDYPSNCPQNGNDKTELTIQSLKLSSSFCLNFECARSAIQRQKALIQRARNRWRTSTRKKKNEDDVIPTYITYLHDSIENVNLDLWMNSKWSAITALESRASERRIIEWRRRGGVGAEMVSNIPENMKARLIYLNIRFEWISRIYTENQLKYHFFQIMPRNAFNSFSFNVDSWFSVNKLRNDIYWY